MNPKPLYAGLLACILFASCHTSQSTTYSKKGKKAQPIQLPNVSQQLQVEAVQEKP